VGRFQVFETPLALARYKQASTDLRHLPERGYALLAAGRCLADLGRPAARERLAEARTVFADLGARPLLALADGGLAEVSGGR
jgi:hypothetical protein